MIALGCAILFFVSVPQGEPSIGSEGNRILELLRQSDKRRSQERCRRVLAALEGMTCQDVQALLGDLAIEKEPRIVSAFIDRAIDIGSVEAGRYVLTRLNWESPPMVLRACAHAAAALDLNELDDRLAGMLRGARKRSDAFDLAQIWVYQSHSLVAIEAIRSLCDDKSEAQMETVVDLTGICRDATKQDWLRSQYLKTGSTSCKMAIVRALGRIDRQANAAFLREVARLVASDDSGKALQSEAASQLLILGENGLAGSPVGDVGTVQELTRCYSLQWWSCSKLLHTLDSLKAGSARRALSNATEVTEFLAARLGGAIQVKLVTEDGGTLPTMYGGWHVGDPVRASLLTFLERNAPMFSDLQPTDRDLVVWGAAEPESCLMLGSRARFLQHARSIMARLK